MVKSVSVTLSQEEVCKIIAEYAMLHYLPEADSVKVKINVCRSWLGDTIETIVEEV